MRGVIPVLIGLLLGAGSPRAANASPERTAPRHLVLIVADTLRADVLGCYGGEAHTPNLDALAAEGVRFERTYSHIPITGPSHASLFTSLLPSEHGVLNNTQLLAAEHATLAEVLRDSGFHTAAFISLGVLKERFGTAQGFDEYHQWFEQGWVHDAHEVNRRLLPWIAAREPGRLFLWAHYSDPHEPYGPPGFVFPGVSVTSGGAVVADLEADGRYQAVELVAAPGTTELVFEAGEPAPERDLMIKRVGLLGDEADIQPARGLELQASTSRWRVYRSALPAVFTVTNDSDRPREVRLEVQVYEKLGYAEMRRRYLLEVEFLDAQLGRLRGALEAAGLWQDSVVVFTSDHGEGLGDHDLGGHIHQLYDSLSRVPLIVVAPGVVPRGVVESSTASLVDLAPTAYELLAVEPPAGLRGHSLVAQLGDQGPERAVVTETFKPESRRNLRAVVHGGYKYIRDEDSGAEELYHLVDDPGELHDLAAELPEHLARMRTLLAHELASGREPGATEEVELDEEEIRQLEALGYVR